MIDKLRQFDNDDLESWFDMSFNQRQKFCMNLVEYADHNQSEFRTYVNSIIPSEASSLSVIFESLTTYSSDYYEFVFTQIERLVNIAKQSKTPSSILDLFLDLNLEKMHKEDYEVFKNCVEFLIESLDARIKDKYNLAIIDGIDTFLLEEDSVNKAFWRSKIDRFAETKSKKFKKSLKKIVEPQIINNLKNKRRWRMFPVILMLVSAVLLASLSYYFYAEHLAVTNPDDLSSLTSAIFTLVLFLICVYGILATEVYEIGQGKLKFKSILGYTRKSVSLAEIDYYTIKKKSGKYEAWENITLFSSDKKHKITSYGMSLIHFVILKINLTKNLRRNSKLEKRRENRSNRRVGTVLALVLFTLVGLLLSYNFKTVDIITDSDQFVLLEGTLSNQLEIGKSKRSRFINIKLNELPEHTFKVSGFNFKAADTPAILNDFSPGDSIELIINKDVYQKKISKTLDLTFMERVFFNNNVQVFELQNRDFEYISLDYANELRRENTTGWAFWFVILLLVLFGIGGLFKVLPIFRQVKVNL